MRHLLVRAPLLCVALVALATARQTPAQSNAVSLPTFGIEVTPPAGWERQFESAPHIIARWAPAGADPQKQFIEIVARPRSGTDLESARDLAQHANSKVFEGLLDGRKAYRIWNEGEGFGSLFCTRGEIQYAVGFSFADQGVLDDFCTKWKWREAEPLSKHTELDPSPLLVFDRLAMQLPSWVRPAPNVEPGSSYFGGDSFAGGRLMNHFFVVVRMLPDDRGKPLEQMAVLRGMAQQKMESLPSPVPFRKLVKGDRMIGAPVDKKPQPGKTMTMSRVALLAPDAQERYELQLTVFTRDRGEQEAYAAMFQKIVESIEALPPQK
jgi:hypothetical protein